MRWNNRPPRAGDESRADDYGLAQLRDGVQRDNGQRRLQWLVLPERAQHALATLYLDGRRPYVRVNKRKGIALLKAAASANVVDAQFDLANCYELGEGVDKDERIAFEWYLFAALHGHSQCVWEVGRCYCFGIGITQDRRLADIFVDRAKELGIDESADGEVQDESSN